MRPGTHPPWPAEPTEPAERIEHVEHLLRAGVRDRIYPCAVWAVGDADGTHATGATGVPDPAEPDRPARTDTLFDLASLTKIIAVWAAVGALWEDGVLPLDDPLGTFRPELAGLPLGAVTARQLLTHTAGVPLHADLANRYGSDPRTIRSGVLGAALDRPPGTAVEYTDRAALILGYLAEQLADRPLDRLARARVWQPLGMDDTRFGPLPAELADRCAPTEFDPDTGTHLRGVVHDPSARLLAGVCGVAGAFAPLDDLARFLRYLLDPASTPTRPGFGPAWVEESLAVHTGDLEPARGLFWHPAPGTEPAEHTFVHYGFTGTAMWVSPKRNRWAVLLTNKVYYTRDREPLTAVRNRFRQLTVDGDGS